MIYHQYLSERYDEKYPSDLKFDNSQTIEPNSQEYGCIDAAMQERFVRGNGRYLDRVLLHEKIALAEVNLRTRGLIGLALGSMVPRLVSPPEHLGKLHKHSDIDVLILNEFSQQHPRPFEWGVDWFARPPNGLAPTNGLVRLWYDIELKPDVSVAEEPATRDPRLPFYLDYEDLKLKYEFEADDLTAKIVSDSRNKAGNCLLKPGLYLPSASILGKIRENADRVKEELPAQLEEARTLLQEIEQLFQSGETCDGQLIKQAMNHFNKLNERLNVLPELAIKDETQFYKELEEDHEKLERIITLLKRAYESLASRCKTVCEKDHSYLDYSGQSTKRALYPILSEDILTFKSL